MRANDSVAHGEGNPDALVQRNKGGSRSVGGTLEFKRASIMDGIEPQAFLFAALFASVGVTTILRRNLTLGWDDDASNREIKGNAAIALGFAMVVAGVGTLINQTYGFIMFVVVWAYASIVARR